MNKKIETIDLESLENVSGGYSSTIPSSTGPTIPVSPWETPLVRGLPSSTGPTDPTKPPAVV